MRELKESSTTRSPRKVPGLPSRFAVTVFAVTALAITALAVVALDGGEESAGSAESTATDRSRTETIRTQRIADALALPDARAESEPSEGEAEPLEILRYQVTPTAARPVPDEVPPIPAPDLEPGPVSLPAAFQAPPEVSLTRAVVPAGPGIADGSGEVRSERVVRGIVKRGDASKAAGPDRLRFRPGSEAARNAEGNGSSIGDLLLPNISLVGTGADCDSPGGRVLPVGRGVTGFTGVAQRPGLRGAFRGGGGGGAAVNQKGPGRRF